MSQRAIHAFVRPAFRSALLAQAPLRRPGHPLLVSLLPALPAPSSPSSLLVRTKKTKASKKSTEEDDDGDAGPGKGKGGKRGKGKLLTEDDLTDKQLPGERFELKKLEERMGDSIGKLRVGLKTVVGRVGRITPALLDNIRVDSPEGKRPLGEFATVSVKDGKDLLVTCYEEAGVKAVTAALYASPLNLTPQPTSATSIRVPVPRPDWDKRQQLVRDAQALCEKARIAIRQVRTDGQKEIKADVDAKVVGKEEARTETKKLDDATKKKTAEVDKIFEDAKKVLMDE
ncbi:SPOSA6832_00585 [Sporobolomyces salmonicolor]|uniref:SPOSA6832_00585-mRNA-1:cds n=1 Tax=Sporidiobolus salmonicolor TaxID=5005 RepID=A0A0D6EGL8_SPOSA|nr:SPOSA6832_00585 [Sporobolomyces salmonicolor]